MKVEMLLDKNYHQKYLLLNEINKRPEKKISELKLQEYLKIKNRTLLRILNEIKEDINALGYEDVIRIEQTDTLCREYLLLIDNCFSIDILILSYFENSIRFQLVIELFYETLGNVTTVADKYFVSEVTLRRLLKEIIEFFRPWGIILNIKHKINLVGDEVFIQSVYVEIFYKVYRGLSWPFQYIKEDEIDRYVIKVLKKAYEKCLLINRVLANYVISISIIRSKKMKIYTNNDFYLYYSDCDSYHHAKSEALIFLGHFFPFKNLTNLEFEFRLHCSLLLINGLVDTLGELPVFISDNIEIRRKVIPEVKFLITRVELYSRKSFPKKTYNIIFSEMCISHYSAVLLYDAVSIIPRKWVILNDDDKKKYNEVFVRDFEQFYLGELKNQEFENLEFYSSFLLANDVARLLKLIPPNILKNEINILLESKYEEEIKSVIELRYRDKYSLNFFDVETPELCLIIVNELSSINNYLKKRKKYIVFLWDFLNVEESLDGLGVLFENKKNFIKGEKINFDE